MASIWPTCARSRQKPGLENARPRIAQQYQALIAADVKADTRKLYSFEEFETGLNGSLKTFVDQRRAFLLKATANQAAAAR